MVDKIVRLLAQANENLAEKMLKTILTIGKVKEQICMNEVQFDSEAKLIIKIKMEPYSVYCINTKVDMNSDSVYYINKNEKLTKSTC